MVDERLRTQKEIEIEKKNWKESLNLCKVKELKRKRIV